MHKHVWYTLCEDAVGRYEDQEGQSDQSVYYCHGRVEACSERGCKALQLVPHDPNLQTVTVEKAA